MMQNRNPNSYALRLIMTARQIRKVRRFVLSAKMSRAAVAGHASGSGIDRNPAIHSEYSQTY